MQTYNCADDFDNAINKTWKENNPIPDIYPRYTNFTKLSEELEILKIKMCQDEKNTFMNKVFNLFLNQNDESAISYIQENKVNPILSQPTKTALIDYLLEQITNGDYTFFHICHSGTERNPQFQIPQFSLSGLSLPDMSYYTEREDLKEDFINMIKSALSHFDNVSGENVEFIWDLEKELSTYHYTRAERREPMKTYHPTTMYFVKEKMKPYFDSLETFLPPDYHDIVLNNHHILDGFKSVIESYSLEQLKTWFTWRVIKKNASYTTGKLYMNQFDFYSKKLNGVKKPKSLEKRGAIFTEEYLSDIFSKLYLENHVDPSIKENFVDFVETLRSALLTKLEKAEWMCENTRVKALDKLRCMELKVVGPSELRDYHEINKDYSCFLEFIESYYKWDWDVLEVNEKMYKMRNPKEWLMSSMTINAYYHPLYNEIVFPAGILQPPFYTVGGNNGRNLGGIGAVIAHEMTHGFDDQGSRFDKNGFLRNWWSKETRLSYEAIIKNMENHFNSLEYEDKPVNGKLTQGENLADLGEL